MTEPPRTAPTQELRRALEPLWVAALGIHFILGGSFFLPRLIRLLGRGGAVETVEWAVYMSMLFVFPIAVAIIGWWLPRVAGDAATSAVKQGLVLLLALLFAIYAVVRLTIKLVSQSIRSAGGLDPTHD